MTREIIRAGAAAPSVDNCQPWLFSPAGDCITISVDDRRASFFGDTDRNATYVTFGSVIENMAVAARQYGFETRIGYFPGPVDNTIARIELVSEGQAGSPLFSSLYERHTNRRPYEKTPIPEEVRSILTGILDTHPDARLFWIDDRQTIDRLGGLIRRMDRIVFEHEQLHADLFRWIRWSSDEAEKTGDGLPLEALEIDVFQRAALKAISSWRRLSFLNRFGISRIASDYSCSLARRSPALALLVMDGCTPVDYLTGGRLLERIWLTATVQGLSLHPLAPIVFFITKYLRYGGKGFNRNHQAVLHRTYEEFSSLFPIRKDNGCILLFRLGYAASPSSRAPRRPLDDVVVLPHD